MLPVLIGCAHLDYVAADPATYVASHRPQSLVVSTKAGPRLGIAQPRIVGDSLVGSSGTRPESERIAVGLSEVTGIYVRRIDGSRTALAVASGLAGLYLVSLFGTGT